MWRLKQEENNLACHRAFSLVWQVTSTTRPVRMRVRRFVSLSLYLPSSSWMSLLENTALGRYPSGGVMAQTETSSAQPWQWGRWIAPTEALTSPLVSECLQAQSQLNWMWEEGGLREMKPCTAWPHSNVWKSIQFSINQLAVKREKKTFWDSVIKKIIIKKQHINNS